MQKAIIMGNGPSLKTLDLKKVKDDPNVMTFACNRIDLLIEQESREWYPDFYICFTAASRHSQKWKNSIESVVQNEDTQCFLLSECSNWLGDRENVTYVRPYEHYRHSKIPHNLFETDIEKKFLKSYSATTSLVQLALSKGFQHLLIIGQDGYQISKKENHFSPEYGFDPSDFKKTNRRMIELHNVLKNYAIKHKVMIENLSGMSILDMYPRSLEYLKSEMLNEKDICNCRDWNQS